MIRHLASIALAVTILGGCASTPRGPAVPDGRVALRLLKTDGTPFNLAALRGRIVLVAIFATWSDPALVELKLYQDMKERFDDFEVVCAVLEEDLRMVAIFEETFDVPFTIGMVENPALFTGPDGPFGPISIMPTSVLLDRDGRIAARMDGMWAPKVLPQAIQSVRSLD